MGLVLGFKSPLLAIQLLWVNLVTDSLPAIAIGLEPPEKDIMNRKPVDSKKRTFCRWIMEQNYSRRNYVRNAYFNSF